MLTKTTAPVPARVATRGGRAAKALIVLAGLTALTAGGIVFASNGMRNSKVNPMNAKDVQNQGSSGPQSSVDGAACQIGAQSACGLPSNVVIDMANVKIRHTDDEWRKLLTSEQFAVTRKQGTEPAFKNAFWNDHRDGVFFSVCSDTPLFDSRDKFDSGTGWPSFTKPIEPAWVSVAEDASYGMVRDEVHCSIDGAHLGHVFDDGPPPTGKRYCINSASLRFVPRNEYEAWVARHAKAAAGDASRDPSTR